MQIKNLENIAFVELMTCFLKAFENYFVTMPTDYAYYKLRWKMAKVRLNLSYGMFDNKKLVGFIINAIDERAGHLIAFNTGTGVLPDYRGKRIIKSIYQHAIPELRKNKISKCSLEVIKDNTTAIKAYQGIGFSINKSYKCYNGNIVLKTKVSNFELNQVDYNYFDWNNLEQSSYSWDNHYTVIAKGNYAYYTIINGTPESYFIINKDTGYIAQFNVFESSPNNWLRLFTAIKTISKTIKINNVDEALTQKNNFLIDIGLKNTIDQYEMELFL